VANISTYIHRVKKVTAYKKDKLTIKGYPYQIINIVIDFENESTITFDLFSDNNKQVELSGVTIDDKPEELP
jgi:hypothetical protein